MADLREELVKLAAENPELRSHLVPLLEKQAAVSPQIMLILREILEAEWDEFGHLEEWESLAKADVATTRTDAVLIRAVETSADGLYDVTADIKAFLNVRWAHMSGGVLSGVEVVGSEMAVLFKGLQFSIDPENYDEYFGDPEDIKKTGTEMKKLIDEAKISDEGLVALAKTLAEGKAPEKRQVKKELFSLGMWIGDLDEDPSLAHMQKLRVNLKLIEQMLKELLQNPRLR